MSETRKDPISRRWVIFASERNKRPGEYPSTRSELKETLHDGDCPFCAGNERFTENEIHRINNGSGWDVRCVPNRFPTLQVEGDIDKKADGIYDCMSGLGAHEVIIETPRHNETLGDLNFEHFHGVMRTYRDRIVDLRRDMRFKYILVFKNHGVTAGQMIPHSHSQLIALPFVPHRVHEEIESCWAYYQFKDRYLFDDIIQQEMKDRSRVVDENEHFVAMCPYAARFPFEVWITPKYHAPHFENTSDSSLLQLSSIFRGVIRRIEQALNFPAYNLMLHNAPVHMPPRLAEQGQSYQWHFEIIPKVTRIAGFEWGTGCYINPTLPEEAAAYLRRMPVED